MNPRVELELRARVRTPGLRIQSRERDFPVCSLELPRRLERATSQLGADNKLRWTI